MRGKSSSWYIQSGVKPIQGKSKSIPVRNHSHFALIQSRPLPISTFHRGVARGPHPSPGASPRPSSGASTRSSPRDAGPSEDVRRCDSSRLPAQAPRSARAGPPGADEDLAGDRSATVTGPARRYSARGPGEPGDDVGRAAHRVSERSGEDGRGREIPDARRPPHGHEPQHARVDG